MLRTEDIAATPPKWSVRRLVKGAISHPAVRTLGAPVRDAWWRLRALRIRNPPVPHHVSSVLFVCLGNICRSPFAAALAARLLAEAGRSDVRCASAGIRPSQDNRSPDEACRASTPYGVTLTHHRPQELTRELMESHDMVIVMEWRQVMQLRESYPDRRDHVFLLPLFEDGARGGYARYNIADPFGQPLAAFEECYRRMDRSLRRYVAAIA